MLHQETLKCLQIAENFEERTFQESPNKEIYFDKMSKKMAEIHQRRQQAAQAAMQGNQMGVPMPMGNVMGMPQNGMGNMGNMQNLGLGNGMNMNMNNMNNMGMGMNMNGMGNNGMAMAMQNQMGANGQQNPNFPAQLQRQMQPSPIPQQNQQLPNNTLDPSALQNTQMQNQNQMMRQQMMNQSIQQQASQPKQPPNMNATAPMGGGGAIGNDVVNNAKRIYDSLSEEKKNQMRAGFMNNLNEQQKASVAKDGDPLFKFLIMKSKEQKQRQAQMNQQNGGNMQMGNNNVMGVNANSAQQTPASQPGGSNNFDFSSIMGQQQNAIKSQESGEQVVPASNNNMGVGQMNMSQGVNPQQLLANQNNQGGNTNNQMQFLAMQQRMAQQRQMALQNQMQQQGMGSQQAQNQSQSQLHGQRGGLNTPNALNGGQVNSPAMNMNMLNRPMAPPGQTTPSTPQPNRPQMPQTPVNPANQLVQHHQSMINQNNTQVNQRGQGPTPQQQLMMANLPEPLKQRFAGLAPEQMQQVLQRIRENPTQYAAIAQGLQNGGPGMMQQNMGMGGPQVGSQQQMMQGMPPNMSNAVPAFNSQPPANQSQQQQQQQQGPNNAQPNHMQKMQQQQAQALRQRAMDLGEYAKPVPQNLGIQLPSEARTWGDIKRHIQENQGVMPPNLLEKLHTLQQQWYTAHPEDFRLAMTQLQAQMRGQHMQAQQSQQQMPPSARPPSAQPAPNGQAPPAQMVPPNAQMQQQQQANQSGSVLNVNQMQLKQPTPEQIQMFRQNTPNAANMTDVEIRNALMRRRQQGLAAHQQQAQQAHQMQQAANIRRAQALAGGGPAPVPDANLQQQQKQQRPAQQQQQPPIQQMNTQGQKRQQSGSDDVMEIPNPNQQPSMNNAQRQGAPQMPQGPFKFPTKTELEKMDPPQKLMVMERMRQMDAFRKAQGGLVNPQGAAAAQQPQTQVQQPAGAQQKQPGQPQSGPGVTAPEMQALENKVKALWEEVKRTTPKGPPITLDSEGLTQVQVSLKRLWAAVKNLDRTFFPALRAQQFGEERVKQAMRAKIIVEQNSADSEGTTKDYLSVSPAELRKLEVFIGQYFTALRDLKNRQDAARAAAAGTNPAQQQAAQTAAQPAKPPPPAAPLRKQSQSHARKQSAANKAPPAPTDNTKTFDWGGAQSPQGVPKYENTRSELTADKLKLPPQKKRRTGGQAGSAESTPAATISTPQGAGASPSVTGTKAQAAGQPTKLQPQVKVEAPKFRCDDPLCEYSIRGFDTQEQLKQHNETTHKPVEDPLQFLQDVLTASEKTLQIEKPAIAQKAVPQQHGKPMPIVAMKKEGQTPDAKTETITPRLASALGKATAKPTPMQGKKVADAKTSDQVAEVPEKEKTLLESMAAKIGYDLPVCEAPRPSTPPPVVMYENSIFEDLMMNNGIADGSNWFDYTADLRDAHWDLHPELESSPEPTPSDGTSQSSRESDVSQSERLRINFEWDAFGNGDTAVPEGLLQSLDIGLGGDGAMVDANGKETKTDEQFNWSDDMSSWDALFGPNAGLDDEPVGMVF